MNIFTGVPVWKEEVDESQKDDPNVVYNQKDNTYYKLHFGDLQNAGVTDWSTFNQYFTENSQIEGKEYIEDGEQKTGSNPYKNPYNFYTYDITP